MVHNWQSFTIPDTALQSSSDLLHECEILSKICTANQKFLLVFAHAQDAEYDTVRSVLNISPSAQEARKNKEQSKNEWYAIVNPFTEPQPIERTTESSLSSKVRYTTTEPIGSESGVSINSQNRPSGPGETLIRRSGAASAEGSQPSHYNYNDSIYGVNALTQSQKESKEFA